MFEGLFQPMHLLLILVIALIIFGPGKLPELGSALGKAKKASKRYFLDGKTPQMTQLRIRRPKLVSQTA